MCLTGKGGSGRIDGESETFVCPPLTRNPYGDHESREGLLVSETLRGHVRPGSATTGPICFSSKDHGADAGDVAPTLRAMPHDESHANGGGQVAVSGVRRLTPRECERLQGFPDDYTLVSYRGKLASDGPRYRAIGNSMAVPVMAWIGRRIEDVANWGE